MIGLSNVNGISSNGGDACPTSVAHVVVNLFGGGLGTVLDAVGNFHLQNMLDKLIKRLNTQGRITRDLITRRPTIGHG
jgi:hypothetical protein